MDASQYKDYVLVLLFVKYVSDKYAGEKNAIVIIPKNGGFEEMKKLKGKPNIGEGINVILSKLAEVNKLKGVIDVVDFNDEDKLGKGTIKKIIKNEVMDNNPGAVVLLESIEDDLEEMEEEEEETEDLIDEVEGRSKWKTLLLGTDYKNLGHLRSKLVQTTNTIRKKNKTMTKNVGEDSQLMLEENIEAMEQEKARLTEVITESEDQFSILGWVKKLFSGYKDLDESDLDTEVEVEETEESTPSEY